MRRNIQRWWRNIGGNVGWSGVSPNSLGLATVRRDIPRWRRNIGGNIGRSRASLTKALSSYSAVIQLYLQSGQLDTSLSHLARLNDDQQPWCHFGCSMFEDPHHTFVNCLQFYSLRMLCASELYSTIDHLLQASSINPADQKFIQDQVRDLFLDSDIWPAQRSLFYLGLLPPLFPPMFNEPPIHTHIAHECHTTSIRLAGHIWAAARHHYFHQHFAINHTNTSTRTTIVTTLIGSDFSVVTKDSQCWRRSVSKDSKECFGFYSKVLS